MEDRRKKAVAAKLGADKVKPKCISLRTQKKAAKQRQRGYQTVIKRKANCELVKRDQGDELDDKKHL